MLGRLHVEMAMLNAIGNRLNGSGWAEITDIANVTTEGREVPS